MKPCTDVEAMSNGHMTAIFLVRDTIVISIVKLF